MTDVSARLDAWLDDARRRLRSSTLGATAEEVGRIESVADGIALVTGLRRVCLDELVRFEKGQMGFVLTLERNLVGCVLLDDSEGIEAGHEIRGAGEIVRAPVGPELLGRVVDPLGRPLDGEGLIEAISSPSRCRRASWSLT